MRELQCSMSTSRWKPAAPAPLIIRAGWGLILLIVPGTVLRLFGAADTDCTPRRVMRVLGARHLAQAGAEYRLGGRAREIGIGVDLLHGTSSIMCSVVSPTWRRVALVDAGVATAFAVLGATNG
jgi:hypothetical protein